VVDISNPTNPTRVGAVTLASGEDSRFSIAVSGRYAYVTTGTSPAKVVVVDINGIETTSLTAHSLEAGTFQVRQDATIYNRLFVGSGLGVGIGGIQSSGPLSVTGDSTFAGNVGIGTTSPSNKLHISAGAEWQPLRIGGTHTNGVGLSLLPSDAYPGFSIWAGVGTYANKLFISRQNTVSGSNELITITDTGNVGIGTTAPAGLLDISGTGANNLYIRGTQEHIRIIETDASNKQWKIEGSGGDFYITEHGVGHPLVIKAGGNVGIGTTSPSLGGANFKCVVKNLSDIRVAAFDGYNQCSTWYGVNGNPRAAIDVYGDGTTNFWRYVNENWSRTMTSGGSTYMLDVYGSAHASSFPTSSDERFKTDVKPINDALNIVMNLQGVRFRWSDFYKNTLGVDCDTEKYEFGVIAQETEKVAPEVITKFKRRYKEKTKDGKEVEKEEEFLSVDYGRLVAVLIEAIKELYKELQAVKTESKLDQNTIEQ
jgi:hypothetical protein